MTIRLPSRMFTLVATICWLAAALFLTLRPLSPLTPVAFWSVFVGPLAGADAVQNIVMFAPFGWIAHRAGWPARRNLLAALLVSGGIEFAQQWVHGRTSQASDIAFDALGAALGWWMATPAVRPRLRLSGWFAVVTALLGLHALNTQWPAPAVLAAGEGAWQSVQRHPCSIAAREFTVCVTLPNSSVGDPYLRIIGPTGLIYARMEAATLLNASIGKRAMKRGDCLLLDFPSTIGAQLHFQPPYVVACTVVGDSDRSIEVPIDPRLEHFTAGPWTPTRAGVWMWPVWPSAYYHPELLRAVGALAFVIGTSMLVGAVYWWIPLVYWLALGVTAIMTGMGRPDLWELGWAALGCLVAHFMVQIDMRWRQRSAPPEKLPVAGLLPVSRSRRVGD